MQKSKDTNSVQKGPKKPYRKPEVRFERVFETMALTCGKLSGGGPQCIGQRKTS